MECPKGHRQLQTYGNWRKHPICQQCMAGDVNQVNRHCVPQKTKDVYRILALDAATGTTGYSIFDNEALVNFGKYEVDRNLDTEARINEMKQWLLAAIEDWEPNFVGIENIQLQSFGNNNYQVELYRALANLQGVLIDTLYEAKIPHALAYASQWRKYCDVGNGRGRENKKQQAQERVKEWYGQKCTQDEADAICIGKYFVGYVKNHKSSDWGEDI